MTNFEPIKKRIWKSVQKNDKDRFNHYCEKLMERACDDWWQIGWNICPKNINGLLKLLDRLTREAHQSWIKAMKRGDVPPEDVSPGEGFALCAKLIREAIKKEDNKK